METLTETIVAMSRMVDESYSSEVQAVPELHDRRRLDKILEEYVEVKDAYNGMIGENPRKGVIDNLEHVLEELLDVATAALGCFEHLNGHQGNCQAALELHAHRRRRRLESAIENQSKWKSDAD